MIDCIEAVIAPKEATKAAYPNALICIVEDGRLTLHVMHGRDEALALCRTKRARTRDGRYDLAVRLIEESILPAVASRPTEAFAGTKTGRIIDVAFQAMFHLTRIERFIFDTAPRFDVFMAPRAPEDTEGLAAYRKDGGYRFETFRSITQGEDALDRMADLMTVQERETCLADLHASFLPKRAGPPSPAIGGYIAGLLGGAFRLREDLRAARGSS